MKRTSVPQDHARAFMGHSKVLYAEDADGRNTTAPSDGWEAEEIVLDQAIAEYERQARDAWQRARDDRGSALAYHMFHARMDVVLLAQSTGIARWRVRRHLRRGAFAALPQRVQAKYADALGKSADELDALPEQP